MLRKNWMLRKKFVDMTCLVRQFYSDRELQERNMAKRVLLKLRLLKQPTLYNSLIFHSNHNIVPNNGCTLYSGQLIFGELHQLAKKKSMHKQYFPNTDLTSYNPRQKCWEGK